MKKYRHIVIIALLTVLAGCVKIEYNEEPAARMAFVVESYVPQTRALSVKEADGYDSFSSRAYLHAEGVEDVQYYFNDYETVNWNGSVWTPDKEYLWPTSDKSYINFVSWAGGMPSTNSYAKSGDSWTANLAWTDFTVASGAENLIYADLAWHYNKTSALATTYQMDGSYSGVPTLFRHALARVGFKAKAAAASEGEAGGKHIEWTVGVTEIKVTGIKNTGSFAISNTEPAGTTAQTSEWTVVSAGSGWTSLSGEDNSFIWTGSKELTTVVEDVFPLRSAIPQDISAAKVSVKYSVTTKYWDGSTLQRTVVENVESESSLAVGGITAFDRNVCTIYTLVINPDTNIISIIPQTIDWVERGEDRLVVE